MNVVDVYYRECEKITVKRNWVASDYTSHFVSGVSMGVGLFNLVSSTAVLMRNESKVVVCLQMISQLPSRILKILEFIGFSGNKVCTATVETSGPAGTYFLTLIIYFRTKV